MATLNIDRIESALADQGIETLYTGTDDYTSFLIRNGSTELEILDAVSGGSFRSEDLTEAIRYRGDGFNNETARFEDVETVEEFLKAVADVFA